MRLLLLLTISFPLFLSGQTSVWKMVVNDSDSSKYFSPTANVSNAWVKSNFNDSSWSKGKGGFGTGDNDDSTVVVASPSIFIRHKFVISDSSNLNRALAYIDYDDGFVAYLNGIEVARKNMNDIIHPNYADLANQSHEALLKGNGIPEAFIINQELLINDTNIFCIQIHNVSHTSPDVTARFWINAEEKDSTTNYRPLHTWMNPSIDLIQTKLPLVLINTNGEEIKDHYRVDARMEIIHNDKDNYNTRFSKATEYDGDINIEIRGTSSSNYPKKQFSLETQDVWGTNNNVSIFGWPKENDWILYAPYSDKSLLRNVLAYKISAEMNHYAPRTQLCEVFINNEYQGVYVFTEKVKRDEGRVDISKLKKSDLSGNKVSGGYILQVDRQDLGKYSWTSPYSPLGGSTTDINIICTYPKLEDIQLQQINYINNWFTSFEDNLNGGNFDNPKEGYKNYIDVNSFIDFFLVQEISKNVDGYRLSSYLHKDRSDKDSLLHAGPVWDFNLGFGNADYCQGGSYEGWAYNFNDICSHHFNQVPFWWSKLLEDEQYRNQLKCRWNELRASTLRTKTLNKWIDQQVEVLSNAQVRNFETWNVLSSYVDPNNYIGHTYENEVDYFKTWLNNRLEWMDLNMYGYCDIPLENEQEGALKASVYPTAFHQELTLRVMSNSPSSFTLSIWDQVGKLVHRESLGSKDIGNHEFSLNHLTNKLSQGSYILQVSNTVGTQHSIRILKQ